MEYGFILVKLIRVKYEESRYGYGIFMIRLIGRCRCLFIYL